MAYSEAYYQRKAQLAAARRQYLANRPARPAGTAVNSRGAATDVYYRSVTMVSGTEHLIYRTSVQNRTLALLSATDAGLKTTLAGTEVANRLKGSGVKPARAHWFGGDATPTVQTSPWGSNWTRYYSTAGEQSHFSIPLSQATGVFSANDLADKFNALFGPGGTKRSLLGTANGRAYLEPEYVNIAANS